jgi:large subunit ribosomal protein L35Ae
MRLVISDYRGYPQTRNNQMIVAVEEGDPKSLIGKKVLWTSKTGKKFVGSITHTHGKHSLRVRFNEGLPGQALGTEIQLVK